MSEITFRDAKSDLANPRFDLNTNLNKAAFYESDPDNFLRKEKLPKEAKLIAPSEEISEAERRLLDQADNFTEKSKIIFLEIVWDRVFDFEQNKRKKLWIFLGSCFTKIYISLTKEY